MSFNLLVQRLLDARRQSWSVSQAADRAAQLCGLDHHGHANLRHALQLVVDAVEADGQRLANLGLELPYHNRAHIVDAVTALSCLMHATPQLSAAHQWTALIAMVGHDLGHQGKTNKELQTKQEEITADWVVRCCLAGLSAAQSSQIRRFIELTDPAVVRLNHFAYRKKVSDENLLLQVLINEADIAASMVPQLAVDLTRALLKERGNPSATPQEVAELYAEFKKSCVLSSDAAQLLLSPKALGSQ
jgi:3'5'-cyclic nucleotide phosphodiesterase